jgi:hypothetical protein
MESTISTMITDHASAPEPDALHALDDAEFTSLVERLIYAATENGTLPVDALAALAKALGTLLAFTARREGMSGRELLAASQNAVADYTTSALAYMRQNPDVDPA